MQVRKGFYYIIQWCQDFFIIMTFAMAIYSNSICYYMDKRCILFSYGYKCTYANSTGCYYLAEILQTA